MSFENKGSIAAKVLVTAEPDRRGNFICNGTTDEVEINLAFLHLTSGRTAKETVKLIGAFILTDPIQVPSYTTLDLTEASLYMANGGEASPIENDDPGGGNTDIEVVGGFIDANWENQTVDTCGMWFDNVTRLRIHDCTVRGGYREGAFPGGEGIFAYNSFDIYIYNNYVYESYYDDIKIYNCNRFLVANNICYGDSQNSGGIQAASSEWGTITDNFIWKTGSGEAGRGIKNHSSIYIIIANNLIYAATYGIDFIDSANYCLVEGNYLYHCNRGFTHRFADGTFNTVRNNVFRTFSSRVCIYLEYGNHYIIKENTFMAADGSPATTIGVQLLANANDCVVKNNDYIDIATPIIDAGTDTILDVESFQFTEVTGGTAAIQVTSPVGCYISDSGGTAIAWGQLPQHVHQVVRLKVWAVAKDAPAAGGGQMHCEFTFNAGASNAAYNTAAKSWNVANKDSEEADYVSDDVIHWILRDADTGDSELTALAAGDSFEILAIYESAASPDGETDAKFRVVEIEYV